MCLAAVIALALVLWTLIGLVVGIATGHIIDRMGR